MHLGGQDLCFVSCSAHDLLFDGRYERHYNRCLVYFLTLHPIRFHPASQKQHSSFTESAGKDHLLRMTFCSQQEVDENKPPTDAQ